MAQNLTQGVIRHMLCGADPTLVLKYGLRTRNHFIVEYLVGDISCNVYGLIRDNDVEFLRFVQDIRSAKGVGYQIHAVWLHPWVKGDSVKIALMGAKIYGEDAILEEAMAYRSANIIRHFIPKVEYSQVSKNWCLLYATTSEELSAIFKKVIEHNNLRFIEWLVNSPFSLAFRYARGCFLRQKREGY